MVIWIDVSILYIVVLQQLQEDIILVKWKFEKFSLMSFSVTFCDTEIGVINYNNEDRLLSMIKL